MPEIPPNADALFIIAAALFGLISILGRILDRYLPPAKNGPASHVVDALKDLKKSIDADAASHSEVLREIQASQARLEAMHEKDDPETGLPRWYCQARTVTADQTKDITRAIEKGFEKVAASVKAS